VGWWRSRLRTAGRAIDHARRRREALADLHGETAWLVGAMILSMTSDGPAGFDVSGIVGSGPFGQFVQAAYDGMRPTKGRKGR